MNQPASVRTFSLDRFEVRVDVISAEATETGGLLAWLAVRPVSRIVRGAMLDGAVRIEETGVVRWLRVENRGERPLLVPADWILDGGRQARVVERSVIVGSGQAAPVPVRCVEKGRWAPRPRADANGFTLRGPATMASRVTFIGAREAQHQRTGVYELEQREVWHHVSGELSGSGTRSRTDSYVDFLDARPQADARSAELVARMPERVNGLLLLDDGDRGWLEVLPGPRELRAVAPAILTGARAAAKGVPLPSRGIDRALAAIRAASLVAVGTPAETLGEHVMVRGHGVSGAALFFAGELVHVAARIDASAP